MYQLCILRSICLTPIVLHGTAEHWVDGLRRRLPATDDFETDHRLGRLLVTAAVERYLHQHDLSREVKRSFLLLDIENRLPFDLVLGCNALVLDHFASCY